MNPDEDYTISARDRQFEALWQEIEVEQAILRTLKKNRSKEETENVNSSLEQRQLNNQKLKRQNSDHNAQTVTEDDLKTLSSGSSSNEYGADLRQEKPPVKEVETDELSEDEEMQELALEEELETELEELHVWAPPNQTAVQGLPTTATDEAQVLHSTPRRERVETAMQHYPDSTIPSEDFDPQHGHSSADLPLSEQVKLVVSTLNLSGLMLVSSLHLIPSFEICSKKSCVS